MSTRVIICEASEIISLGLHSIIQGMMSFDVVSRMDTPDGLSERILSTDANLLIINPNLLGYTDRNLPQMLLKDHPQLTIVALITGYVDPSVLKPYDGAIELNDPKQKIITKLIQCAQDNDKQDKTDEVELSKREIDVLVAVAKGMMNKEIADQMNISIHTVISHRKNITHKTGIKSVSGLTVYALLNNLIDEKDLI